jgi:hypothetical protein
LTGPAERAASRRRTTERASAATRRLIVSRVRAAATKQETRQRREEKQNGGIYAHSFTKGFAGQKNLGNPEFDWHQCLRANRAAHLTR